MSQGSPIDLRCTEEHEVDIAPPISPATHLKKISSLRSKKKQELIESISRAEDAHQRDDANHKRAVSFIYKTDNRTHVRKRKAPRVSPSVLAAALNAKKRRRTAQDEWEARVLNTAIPLPVSYLKRDRSLYMILRRALWPQISIAHDQYVEQFGSPLPQEANLPRPKRHNELSKALKPHYETKSEAEIEEALRKDYGKDELLSEAKQRWSRTNKWFQDHWKARVERYSIRLERLREEAVEDELRNEQPDQL